MNELNIVPNTGTFGEIAERINANFGLLETAVREVEGNTSKECGLFSTLEALQKAHPHPTVGAQAKIGAEPPYAIYVCETDGVWKNTGKTVSPAVSVQVPKVMQTSGGSEDSVMSQKAVTALLTEYDVSAANGGRAYTLADAIAAVPAEFQKPGLKLSFVDSASERYVTFTCVGRAWSTDVSMWKMLGEKMKVMNGRGVSEDSAMSQKAVTAELYDVSENGIRVPLQIIDGHIDENGAVVTGAQYGGFHSQPVLLKSGQKITVGVTSNVYVKQSWITITDKAGTSYMPIGGNPKEYTNTTAGDVYVAVSSVYNGQGSPYSAVISGVEYSDRFVRKEDLQYPSIRNQVSFDIKEQDRAIDYTNGRYSATLYRCVSKPIPLRIGETLHFTCCCIAPWAAISVTDAGGTCYLPVVQGKATSTTGTDEYSYTAAEDCLVVLGWNTYPLTPVEVSVERKEPFGYESKGTLSAFDNIGSVLDDVLSKGNSCCIPQFRFEPNMTIKHGGFQVSQDSFVYNMIRLGTGDVLIVTGRPETNTVMAEVDENGKFMSSIVRTNDTENTKTYMYKALRGMSVAVSLCGYKNNGIHNVASILIQRYGEKGSGCMLYDGGFTDDNLPSWKEFGTKGNITKAGKGVSLARAGNSSYIYLDRTFGINKRAARLRCVMYADTVLKFGNHITFGMGDEQKWAAIDASRNTVELGGKSEGYQFRDGGEYIIELSKDDRNASLSVTDCLTGVSKRMDAEDYCLQYDTYAICLASGRSPLLEDFCVYSLVCRPYIIFYGDSITEGEELPVIGGHVPSRYADLIGRKAGLPYLVSGRAGGGINTVSGVGWKVATELSILRPRYAMLTVGTNFGNTEEGLGAFVTMCRAVGVIPILNNIPCNDGKANAKAADVNPIIELVRKKYGVNGCLMNVATSVNNDGVTFNPDLFPAASGVKVHPNAEGHRQMFLRSMIDTPEIYVDAGVGTVG